MPIFTSARRRARQTVLFTLIGVTCLIPGGALGAEPGDPARGQQLYLNGRIGHGSPLRATTQNDIVVSGSQFSCVSCHRISGYGGSEGGNYVLPITGPTLFHAKELNRVKIFNKLFKETQTSKFDARMRSPGMRPAYTDQTLASVLRTGIDPAGRELNRLMPRYDLSDGDMADLVAYLKTLSARPDPGVDDTTLHIATVVGDGVDPAKKQIMLETMQRFVDWHNLQSDGDRLHPNFSPNYHSTWIATYRRWELDVWQLKGAPDAWPAQLASYYANKPVFALVGGMAQGSWTPVHEFCEREKIPCLYPETDLPGLAPTAAYAVYFTRGLTLEAAVTARHLIGMLPSHPSMKVRQLYDSAAGGSVPAAVVSGQLQGQAGIAFDSAGVRGAAAMLAELDSMDKKAEFDTLVLWPGEHADAVLAWLARHPRLAQRIYLPSAALEASLSIAPARADRRLHFSFPYELPGVNHPRAFVVRAWMRSRGLEIPFPRLQFDTYFAMTMLQFGLEDIIGVFSRDYFLESVEHLAESNLNPGTYPSLSLGPGQRYASRGAHIVQLTGKSEPAIVPVSSWIVP